MTAVYNLPVLYKPFPELRVCSNSFQGVPIPLAIGDFPLLLVGQGELPLLWLAAPIELGVFPWPFVVSANRSSNSAVAVQVDPKKATVKVVVSGRDVLRVHKVSEFVADLAFLDLRPIGLDVSGSSTGLKVGGTKLLGNTLVDLEVGISLAGPLANQPKIRE